MQQRLVDLVRQSVGRPLVLGMRVEGQRVGVLKDGRLVEENEAGKLIESPQQPYTRMLMESTPRFAGGVG